jgi:hypothetical protein
MISTRAYLEFYRANKAGLFMGSRVAGLCKINYLLPKFQKGGFSMKNLKKLFAVIITVAMLASLMVPALAAEGFQYEDDARKLYGLNLFKGISETEYVPALEDNLIRETGLALMIRAAGKEAEVLAMTEAEVATQLAKVVDANEIADWAKPYVAYAVKNGLTDGIDASILPLVKFAPKLDLSGKEFINFMLKAMGYPATEVAWEEVLTKAAEIGMLSPGEAVSFGERSVINRDIAVGILAGAMTGITSSGITLAQKLVEDGVVSAEAMAEAGYFAPTATPTEAPVELGVESVEALNLKQIQIVYNKPVDEDSAEDKSNYSLKGKYVLQDDGVTVIGTLDTAVANQTTKELTIEDVEDIDGYVIADTTVEIDFLDMTIPEALSAEVVGKDTVKVTFSEPINVDEPVLLTATQLRKGFTMKDSAGKTVYVNSVTFDTNNTVARVKFYSSFKEGTYTLTANNEYKDYAGYTVVKKDFTLEVVPDDAPPEVIGYEDAKPYEVTLIFNEDIAIVSKKPDDFYHTNSKNPVVKIANPDDEDDPGLRVVDGNKLKFEFHEDHAMPSGNAYIYIAKDAIKDLWDNKNPQQIMIPVEVVGDTEAPFVEKVEATAQNTLKVTFNEKVQKNSAETRGNYTLLDSDGDEIKNIVRSASLKDKVVTLTLRDDITGEHTLVVEGVKDIYKNEMSEQAITFTVEDKTAPEFPTTATLHGTDVQTLIIDFDDVMATEGIYSVLDLDKYVAKLEKYDDDSDAWSGTLEKVELADIDDGISIGVSDDGKKVEIELDTEEAGYRFNITLDSKITIARVADAAGNKTAELSSPEIDVVDSGTVANDKFEATAKDEIKLTLKSPLADFAEEDYILKAGGVELTDDEYAVEEERDSKGNSVIIFRLLGVELNANGKLTAKVGASKEQVTDGAITVELRKTDAEGNPRTIVSEDAYGAKVDFATPTLTADDKIAPSLVEDDKDTTVNEAVYSVSNTVYLVFDEIIKVPSGDASSAAFDFVVEADGEELDPNIDYEVAVPGTDKVEIILKGDYAYFDGTVTVSTASTVRFIKDEAGNVLAEIEDEDVEVNVAPKVDSVEYKDNKVVIKFTEEMDFASVTDAANYELSGTSLSITAIAVNDDGDEVTITLSANATGSSITIKNNVTDYAGNKIETVTFTF